MTWLGYISAAGAVVAMVRTVWNVDEEQARIIAAGLVTPPAPTPPVFLSKAEVQAGIANIRASLDAQQPK